MNAISHSVLAAHFIWSGKVSAKSLQKEADNTLYYQAFPYQEVSVVVNGMVCNMKGTIQACSAAPKGPCTYTASKYGYTCEACDALTHGQTSPLNRTNNRACTLKYPRSNETRATKPGVKHKFVSAKNLEVAYATNYRHLSVPGGVAQAWYVLSERRFLQADFDLCFIHQHFYAL